MGNASATAGAGGLEGAGGARPSMGGTSSSGGVSPTAGATGGDTSLGGNGSSGGSVGTGDVSRSAGCGVANTPDNGRAAIDVGGTTREYILRLPDDYDPDVPHKLIFTFHARGGNASQIAGGSNDDYYGLFSRSGGTAIFVSPEGIDAGWRNTDGRDTDFVTAMIDELGSTLCVDHARIFSTGFSFGGMMSDAIGCAMADVFRAIAPMAGAVPNPEHPYSGCDQITDHPIAVWMAHGTSDTVVPFADGMDALAIFLERAGCSTETVSVEPSPCVAYQGCDADYPIHLCEFDGGHQVPSFASEGIWEFFDQF